MAELRFGFDVFAFMYTAVFGQANDPIRLCVCGSTDTSAENPVGWLASTAGSKGGATQDPRITTGRLRQC